MSSPARPMIITALSLVSASAGVGLDLSLANFPAEARSVRGRSQLTDADFVRMRLLRTNGRIAIAVDLAGKVDRVNQSVLASSWNGSINTDQKQRSIKGESRFVIPELGNAEVSLIRSGSGLILDVTRQDGRRMNEAVVSETATVLLFAFTPQPVPPEQTGYVDPAQPRRLPQQAYAPQLRRRAVAPCRRYCCRYDCNSRSESSQHHRPVVSVKYRQTKARHAFEDLVARAGYGFVWVPVDSRFNPDQGNISASSFSSQATNSQSFSYRTPFQAGGMTVNQGSNPNGSPFEC